LNWQAIGAIGEITGALAVVITLLYLARQVRHARREQQIAAIRANRNERREYYTTARDSPYLPGILSKLKAGGDLSPEEEQRLTFHYSAAWSVLYSEWIQSQLDLPGEFATSSQFIIRITIALPGSLEWFREYGAHLYPSPFIAHVMQIQEELDTRPCK
jgi:hypothetical protein